MNLFVSNNKSKYYLWDFFRTISFYSPIVTMYYQKNNISFTDIMFLQSWYTMLVIILNIPTSIWADIYGRKKVMILATFLNVLGFIIYGIGRGFITFLLAETILGIASSLLGGVGKAYFFELLTEEEKKHSTKFIANIFATTMLAGVIGNSVGGIIAHSIDFKATFLLSATTSIIALIFVLNLKNDNIESNNKNLKLGYLKYFDKIKVAYKEIISNKILWYLIIQISFVIQLFKASFFYTQPKLMDSNISIAYFGIIFAMFNILSSIVVKFLHKLELKFKYSDVLLCITIIIGVNFVLLNFFNNKYLVVILFLIINISIGITNVLFSTYVNKLINNCNRATILSFIGLFSSLIYMLISPIVGLVADKFSINRVFTFIGVAIILDVLLFKVILNTIKHNKDNYSI